MPRQDGVSPGASIFYSFKRGLDILSRERTFVTTAVAGAFLLAHIFVITVIGTAPPGPVASDLIQLVLGGLVIATCLQASGRSEGLARSFWRLVASAYTLWLIAQGLAVYIDISGGNAPSRWLSNLLFCFWFVPLALTMFLDRRDGLHIDRVHDRMCRPLLGSETSSTRAERTRSRTADWRAIATARYRRRCRCRRPTLSNQPERVADATRRQNDRAKPSERPEA